MAKVQSRKKLEKQETFEDKIAETIRTVEEDESWKVESSKKQKTRGTGKISKNVEHLVYLKLFKCLTFRINVLGIENRVVFIIYSIFNSI